MYIEFKKEYYGVRTLLFEGEIDNGVINQFPVELRDFFNELGGNSFERGLYRTHTPLSSSYWANRIGSFF